MGDPTGLPLVKSKIDSRVQGERMLALIAVKDYPDDELVYHYLKMGLKDPDQSIRTGCIYWLAEQGRPRGVEILKSAYKTFSKSLEKRCALDAVAWTGLWDAMPLLLDGLDDQDSELRQHAAAYLNLLTGETKILKVRDPEDASESSRQWHAWWEQNKSKHPMGTKSDSPALKRGRRYM
jgi:HEAT repeat protein